MTSGAHARTIDAMEKVSERTGPMTWSDLVEVEHTLSQVLNYKGV